MCSARREACRVWNQRWRVGLPHVPHEIVVAQVFFLSHMKSYHVAHTGAAPVRRRFTRKQHGSEHRRRRFIKLGTPVAKQRAAATHLWNSDQVDGELHHMFDVPKEAGEGELYLSRIAALSWRNLSVSRRG